MGFTLIELMVTLAIAAILATMAAPMLSSFLARSQMNAVVNDLTGAIQMARMEAVSRNTCVSICRRATSGAAQCAGDDGAWSSGWLVYENAACIGSVAATDPPAGTTLRAREAVPASISVNTKDSTAPAVISFTPRGVTVAWSNTTMWLSDSRFSDGSMNRSVIVSGAGRVRTVAGLEGGSGE
ncbi:MAG: GspH/FimT family pseudopilin [Burkholderiales bacterium]|nr:GspH/FimT family pseudopilin [Burkholderiales bacterium]